MELISSLNDEHIAYYCEVYRKQVTDSEGERTNTDSADMTTKQWRGGEKIK